MYSLTETMKLVQSQLEQQIQGIAILAIEFPPKNKIFPLTDTIKLVQSQLEHQIYGISIFETEFHRRKYYIL